MAVRLRCITTQTHVHIRLLSITPQEELLPASHAVNLKSIRLSRVEDAWQLLRSLMSSSKFQSGCMASRSSFDRISSSSSRCEHPVSQSESNSSSSGSSESSSESYPRRKESELLPQNESTNIKHKEQTQICRKES